VTDHTIAPSLPPADAGEVSAAQRQEQAQKAFSTSILISGIRCTLAYVVFPFVAPIIGVASGVTSAIGIAVGVVAIVFNIASIRRFWRADHRWKWPMTCLNVSVIVLLVILFVVDLGSLVG